MKRVFITGATRGIGRAMACLFAKEGYEVGFSYHTRSDMAQSLVKEIEKHSKAYAFQCDFSNADEVLKMADQVRENMPEINVLINNAGVSSYGLFQDLTPSEYDAVFSVNVKSMLFLTKALVPDMIQRQSGAIINISSIWGQTGASCEVLYSTTKGAVISFTKALAKELAPSGISVNCIAPGVVDTDMMSRFSKEEKEHIAWEIPSGRFCRPEEIASLALFLANEENKYLTGQVIGMNGGMYC